MIKLLVSRPCQQASYLFFHSRMPLFLFTAPIKNDHELIEKWKQSLKPEVTMKVVELKQNVTRIKFKIPETDLTEEFIKGFGPGG